MLLPNTLFLDDTKQHVDVETIPFHSIHQSIIIPSQAIIPKDPGFYDKGHCIVKLSCSKLARGSTTLIKVLEDMLIKNAQLAVRGSIVLNNMI